ncbi:MAG: hypothetical protein ACK5WC_17230 [Aphanizomenon sp.]|jgi:hypothetical protein|nr:hypothetical protein [Aphanizomenon flos-aquae CP01]
MEINLRCYVELQGERKETEVTLHQEEDGSLFCTLPMAQLTIKLKENVSIQGVPEISPYVLRPATTVNILDDIKLSLLEGTNQLKVDFENLELDAIYQIEGSDEVNFRFYLNNSPFFNSDYEPYNVNISGKPFSFRKDRQGGISPSIEVNNVQYSNLEEIEKIIDDICWLLSFAGGVYSSIARVEACHDDRIAYIKFNSCKEINKFKPGLQIIDDADICKFIEKSYQPYQQNKQNYLLNNLIEVGLRTENIIFIEVKLLLMANFLEVLRYNYALNIAVPRGDMRQQGKNFKWTLTNKRAEFEPILIDFCNNHNISDWNNDFVDVRNEIVHTGDLSGDQATRYRQMYQFCNRVILALLDWDLAEGEYIRRGSLTKEAYRR